MFMNAVFHWKTQLQRHVTLSSTEAEVIALCSLAKELAWIRRMLVELKLMKDDPALILCVKMERGFEQDTRVEYE